MKFPIQTEFRVEADTGNTLTGFVMLFGAPYACIAVKVQDVDGRQAPVDDPVGFLEGLNDGDPDLDGTGRMTCQLPGRDGDWVLVITPSCRPLPPTELDREQEQYATEETQLNLVRHGTHDAVLAWLDWANYVDDETRSNGPSSMTEVAALTAMVQWATASADTPFARDMRASLAERLGDTR